MSSKDKLLESCKRILWLEQEMRSSYASYKDLLTDAELKETVAKIEQDEARHINMAENILSLLRK